MAAEGPFRSVLFAVDETATSRLALPLVAACARAWGASIHLLHVQPAAPGTAGARDAGELVRGMVGAMERTGVHASGQVHLVHDDPVGATIARLARRVDADLVVVGSRGRAGIEALTPVGVSHAAAAELPVPVLVARVAPGQRPRPVRVLVAINDSPGADRALADAIRVARPTDAAVRVLHVQEAAGAQWEPDADAARLLERGVVAIRGAGLEADEEIVLAGGSVAHAIDRVAQRFDADIVVVASRRPTELQAFVLGSVACELIHVLDRPVLLAHRG